MGAPLPPGIDIDARIGEGGIADVFRGTWEGKVVALKVLREPDRPGLRKRFVREGRLLQRLAYPGLVRCFAVLDAPQPVLVLELLVGASLDIRLRDQGPVTPEQAVRIASASLRTLAYMHENGIVHRDLKPSNIWMGDDGRVVLVDLGLAGDDADPLTTTLGDVLGTHAYMAPEQIAGAETDHRCDLYSLGISLYEALTGERPYQATGLAGYLQAHRAAGAQPVVERVPGVPVRLAALVERLMARDPAARPASAAVALALLTGGAGLRRELEVPRRVGREAVTGAVQAVLDVGGVLRVTGELGSGLGAAARQAQALARAAGVEYHSLRCRARTGPNDALTWLARELESITGPTEPTFAAVRAAMAAVARQDGRLLLIVEDLHLALDGVDTLLDALLSVPELGVVVGGRWLPALPAGRELVLRPLDLAEVRQLVGGMLGTTAVPAGLDVAIHRVSGGLPALVVAILREHVAQGAVWCAGMGEDGRPRWASDPTAPLSPGEGTSRLLDRALRALPDAAQRVVQALAVAGEPVPLDVLLAAAGADPSGADLGPAVRAGFLTILLQKGEEWVSIRRAVLEPILLAGVSEPRERAIHLEFAEAVRLRPVREWEQRFLLLHLALGARTAADAARLVDLGDWLVAGGRPLVALGILDAATRLPVDGGPPLARLALARSEALMQLGRLPEARQALEAGRAVALATEEPDLVDRAALAHVDLALALGGRLPEEGLALLERPEPAPNARLYLTRGAVLLRAGDLGAASSAFGRALELAPPGPVDRVGVAARIGLARIADLHGDLPRAAGLYRGLAAELRAVDRPLGTCDALVRLGEVAASQGRVVAALDHLRAAHELASARGISAALGAIAIGRARVLLYLGDTEGAGSLLTEHATVGETASPWPLRRAYQSLLAELREAEGDLPAMLAAHLRGAEGAAAMPDAPAHAFHAGMVGILTGDSGAVGAAVDALTTFGIPSLTARLLLLGGLTGRDMDVLQAAEDEARASGCRLLLLRTLHASRNAAGGEARGICVGVLDGLFGPLRERFCETPAVRWALGERAETRRDTGA